MSCISFKLLDKNFNKFIYFVVNLSAIILLVFESLCLAISLNLPGSEIIAKHILTFSHLLQEHRNGTFEFFMLIPYIITSIVIFANLIIAFFISIRKNDPLLFLLILSAFISQGLMIMAPYSPLRTTYIAIIFLWVCIAYLINLAYEDHAHLGFISILILTIYNLNFGIFSLILFLIIQNVFNKKKVIKLEIILLVLLIFYISMVNYINILDNYSKNKLVYNENIQRIISFKKINLNGGNLKELYLLPPKDETYGFTPLVGIDWVETAIKNYFELGQDVKLLVEK